MNYNEARDKIQDGDCIAVKVRENLFHELIRFSNRSDITHTGVAVWIDGGLWMAETNGGNNHIVPMSQLENVDFDVYEPPVADRARIRTAITESLRYRIKYGFEDLVPIGIISFLKLKLKINPGKKVVCFNYTAMIYHEAGWSSEPYLRSGEELVSHFRYKFSVENPKPALGVASEAH